MKKTYIVRLSDDERVTCLTIIKKLNGSSEKARRAHILLKADVDGSNWKDQVLVHLAGKEHRVRYNYSIMLKI